MEKPRIEDIDGHWETLIVGGGITGIGILRDLCLQGQRAILVERGDFASATSQATSKMLHGGLRYLETWDFPLVREALGEKILWSKLAPDFVEERGLVLPVYGDSPRPLWQVRLGLALYDFLSGFRNVPHRILSPGELLALVPNLKAEGLVGGGYYHDALVDDKGMGQALLRDALERSQESVALNDTALVDVSLGTKGHYACLLEDTRGRGRKRISCEDLIVAAGPFSDKLLTSFPFIRWPGVLRPSKGSHLYIKRASLPLNEACVLSSKRGRVLFLIPRGEKILVGTTEVNPREEDFQEPTMEKRERDYLLEQVESYFPGVTLSPEDILSGFSGIRPLVSSPKTRGSSAISRRHKIYRPRANLFVVVGGKYTTFRVMASDVVRALFKKKGLCYRAHLSLNPLAKVGQNGMANGR